MPTVERFCGLFLEHCARHRSPATVRFYAGRLKLLRATYGAREWSSLSPLDILESLADAGQGRSDSTRRHNAVALESLQAWLIEQQLIERPLFGKLEKPRMGRRDRVPTPEETERLLARASPAFRRMYLALRQCGARPGEFCRLQATEVDFAARRIVLRQHKTARRTGKPRLIPIGETLGGFLREAMGDRTAGPVFLTEQGKGWTVENLSRTYARLRRAAGLPDDLVLYLARHEFGSELIRRGEDIKTVADLMGHSSVKTTERYIHRDVTELADRQDLIPPPPPPPPRHEM